MKKFNNNKEFLEKNNFVVLTDYETFSLSNEINYKCSMNHETKLAITSFNNKKSKHKNEIHLLCTLCKEEHDNKQKFIDSEKKIFEKNNHKLLKIFDYNTTNCEYECGNCSSICQNSVKNLLKPNSTKYCSKCIKNLNLIK